MSEERRSDTQAELANERARAGRPTAAGVAQGSAWLLHRTDQRQVHARYLAPLALKHRLPTG